MKHGGVDSEAHAREEFRAEIAAMMTGEQLGVGPEPRHGTAYVSSRTNVLENDPKEIRAAAVDAQRISDWPMARERERTVEEEQSRDGPDAGQAARASGREVALKRGDGAPVVPGQERDRRFGADEAYGHAASPRPALSDAQPTPSVPVHDARPNWSQSQESGRADSERWPTSRARLHSLAKRTVGGRDRAHPGAIPFLSTCRQRAGSRRRRSLSNHDTRWTPTTSSTSRMTAVRPARPGQSTAT